MPAYQTHLPPRRARNARLGLLALVAQYGSQAAVGKVLGISQQHVGKLLDLKGSKYTPHLALRIADALGVCMHELIDNGKTGEGDASTHRPAGFALGELPSWTELVERAVEMSGGSPPRLYVEATKKIIVPFRPSNLTPLYVIKLADALYAGDSARDQAAHDAKH